MPLLYESESHEIIGAAMEVHNVLGHGFNEKVYENSLTFEFSIREIDFEQQKIYPVFYKRHVVGECIPDLIVSDKIVVDTKTITQSVIQKEVRC